METTSDFLSDDLRLIKIYGNLESIELFSNTRTDTKLA